MLMLNSMSDYCYVEEYANKKKMAANLEEFVKQGQQHCLGHTL